MQLITEKITLPTARPPLSRPRLIDLLKRSTEMYSTTIISGRTGTGKTLLASDFARHCGRRVAWYSVDATDKDPHFFFLYLWQSLRQINPTLRFPALARHPQELQVAELEQLAEAIIYELQELAEEEPLLLVIDDLHAVYDEPWVLPFFKRFISLLPTEIHLLILARSIIPVPLWRMRSKQNLLTIDESWLAFTHEEASWLFAAHGLGEKQAVNALRLSHGRASVMDEMAKLISQGELYAEIDSFTTQPWQYLAAA
jgi:LuxR family transcriptional regulator, maltose regulon positive regulatory protein